MVWMLVGCGGAGTVDGSESRGTTSAGDATTGTSSGGTTQSASSTGTEGAGSTTTAPASSSGQDGSSTSQEASCDEAVEALVPEVTHTEGGCSVVVRLDYATLEPLGYRAHCGPLVDTALEEQSARDLTECCSESGGRLNALDEEQLWVFHVSPSDFGAVAVVSNTLAQRLFEATIIWSGAGEITFPRDWADPADLAAGCRATDMPAVSTYDLVETGELSPETIDAVWDVIGASALPAAMQTAGSLQRVTILRYPRTVGAFDPRNAEYIVFLEAGR
jgi:hypothetical protein